MFSLSNAADSLPALFSQLDNLELPEYADRMRSGKELIRGADKQDFNILGP